MPGSKPGALTTWRRPCAENFGYGPGDPAALASSASSSGDLAAPAATQALMPGGSAASADSADSRVANSTKQPLPDPVNRGLPTCDSAPNTASTAGSRARRTGSNAFPSSVPETKSDIEIGRAHV